MNTRTRAERGLARRRLGAAGLLVAGLSLVLTGCSSGSSPSASTKSGSTRPLPAGTTPSEISKMVCTPQAQKEIQQTLGVKATVSNPTWVDHTYSCRYQYPDGSFALSVHELSSWPQTLAYFDAIGRRQGRVTEIRNLGQGAFQTSNGSVVVRKDWKVLTVDIADLPPEFGNPPTSRGDVAVTVADLILACWAGD